MKIFFYFVGLSERFLRKSISTHHTHKLIDNSNSEVNKPLFKIGLLFSFRQLSFIVRQSLFITRHSSLPLPGHRNLLQDIFNNLFNRQSFNLIFRPQDQAMFQYRHGHGFNIIRGSKISTVNGSKGPAGKQ